MQVPYLQVFTVANIQLINQGFEIHKIVKISHTKISKYWGRVYPANGRRISGRVKLETRAEKNRMLSQARQGAKKNQFYSLPGQAVASMYMYVIKTFDAQDK